MPNIPVSQFSPSGAWAAQTPYISSWVITTNCRLYSNISQILLLYKTWGCYNKFAFTKSLGVCHWCVKIPQYGYMEHGLKHIKFYVQKHIVSLAMCIFPRKFATSRHERPHLWNSSNGTMRLMSLWMVRILECIKYNAAKFSLISFLYSILAGTNLNMSERRVKLLE